MGGDASFAQIALDLDLRLRTDLLTPLSRWVTPPILPRRFDARFFVAELPPGARVTFEGDEVAGHAWLTPADALTAMADRQLAMWIPDEHDAPTTRVRALDRRHPDPAVARPARRHRVEELSLEVTRIVMPAGGGVAGQPVSAYLVGRRRFVLVDPGDPTGPALDRALEIAAARDGAIAAVALTHVDPDHAAGTEAVAERLGIPILTGPGGGRPLPYAVRELSTSSSWTRATSAPGDPDARSATGPRRLPRRQRGVRPRRRPRRAARRPVHPRPAGRRRLGGLARAPRRPGPDGAPPDRASGDADDPV